MKTMDGEKWIGAAVRRVFLAGLIGLVAVFAAGAQAQELRQVKFGFAAKVMTPMIANILIPERLGYYREEEITVQFVPLGPNSVVLEQLASKRIDFGTGNASFQLPIVAKGEKLPTVNFFEFTYPFKYGLAVKPESPLTSIAALKGKILGVGSFGLTDYPVAKAVLRLAGLDPEKDVRFLAVGEGVPGGQALQRGAIDSFFHYDTGFGSIEAAGIALRYLPLPPDVPKVGGFYIQTRPEILRDDRKVAIGVARATAKAQVFIRENPRAAAYVFLQMFPEAAPKGLPLEQQIAAIMAPMVKRAHFFASYDASRTQWGLIKPAEWDEEIAFLGYTGKVKDVGALYTNDLIDEVNAFDAEKIRAEARAFKVPVAGPSAAD